MKIHAASDKSLVIYASDEETVFRAAKNIALVNYHLTKIFHGVMRDKDSSPEMKEWISGVWTAAQKANSAMMCILNGFTLKDINRGNGVSMGKIAMLMTRDNPLLEINPIEERLHVEVK